MSDDIEREKTLTLTKPIRLGDMEYTEIKLREPMAGELAKASADATNNYSGDIALISLVAAIPRTAVERMGAEDFARASSFLSGFARRGFTAALSSSPT